MKRLLLYGLFVILLLETSPYVHYLGFGPGLSFKNLSLYLFVLAIGLRAALSPSGIRFSDLDVHAVCLILILYSIVSFSVLFAFDPTYPTLRAFIELKSQVIDYYLFFLVYRYGIDTLEDALWLYKAIMRTLLILGVLITMDYLDVPDLGVFGTFQGRTEGFLGEPNEYAAFLVLTMPMLFVAISSVFPRRRFLWAGAFVLAVFLFIATGSRGGFLAALFGFLGGVWFLRRRIDLLAAARFILLGIAGLSILLLVAVVFLDLGFVFQRFDPLTESQMVTSEFSNEMISGRWETRLTIWLDEATSGRWTIWRDNFAIMREQPWSFLVGYGWFSNTLSGLDKTPHSEYILKLYETGAFGLMAFMAVLMVLLFRTRAIVGRLSGTLREIQIAYVFGMCGLTVAILAVQLPNSWPVIWAIIGVHLALQGHAFDGAHEIDKAPPEDEEAIRMNEPGRDLGRSSPVFPGDAPALNLQHKRHGASARRPLSSRKRS